MVGIAQLVESRIVIPVVVGSSPITHPIQLRDDARRRLFFVSAVQKNAFVRTHFLFELDQLEKSPIKNRLIMPRIPKPA